MSEFEASIRALVGDAVRAELAKLGTSHAADEMISTKIAAKVAGVAPGTIRRWVKEGKLREQHAGRVLRISRSDLERMMKSAGPRNDSATPEQLARRKHG